MTRARESSPVLLIGGAGMVGSHAVATLRRLQPQLPLWIGGRDVPKAEALARRAGSARGLRVELSRGDLGVPGDLPVSAVVSFLRDDTGSALRFAQARGVPFIAFSDWLFDVAPEVAQFAHRPAAAPVLLLGHLFGGMVISTTLLFAGELKRVRSIQIGMVVDSDDGGGPATQADFERIAETVPNPLLRIGGKWVWVQDERARRSFTDAEGNERQGRALPLLDVPSLAAATGAANVRVDVAIRDAASRPAGSPPSHSVSIELEGEAKDGGAVRSRPVMLVAGGHSVTSGHGAALAVERMLGLAGGAAPPAGLHLPEKVLEPAGVVQRLRDLGVVIERR